MNTSSHAEERNMFRPFTHKSLETIEEERLIKERTKKRNLETKTEEQLSSEDEDSKPDEALKQESFLPAKLQKAFPRELVNKPLEDIDPFYKGHETFVVITKGHFIYRFDASKAFWMLGPLNLIRRVAISILTHSLFASLMFAVILITCLFMIMPKTPMINTVLLVLTAIYTIEVIVKVTARGFILRPFTYLRSPWNWLDFILTVLAYTHLGPDVQGFAGLRGLRLLHALSTMKNSSNMKTIVQSINQSLRNMTSVLIVLLFFVFTFGVSELLHFMGILTQKCVANFPLDGSAGNLTNENWEKFASNSTNWLMEDHTICGNSSGSGSCSQGYVCLGGYGANPNYGYTNFDTIGWASLSAFRLITLDYWENLCYLVLRAGGPWQILHFISAIFLGSYFLQALILAVVVTTYGELQKKTEDPQGSQKAEQTIDNRENLVFRQGLVKSYSDAQRRFPYIDDSKATTPVTTPITEEDFQTISSTFNNAVNDVNNAEPTVEEEAGLWAKITNFLCIWDCCSPWEKLRELLSLIILNPFVVYFLALCIITDVLLMTLYHHGMGADLEFALESANYFFTIAFAVDVIMKVIAMHPKFYFQEGWNVFEFTVVAVSVLELGFGCGMVLSVLRAFRLVRVIKSAQLRIWPTLNWLIGLMEATVTPLINVGLILFIVVTVFATIGMHLFGKSYIDNIDRFPDFELPRWSFVDFLHSYMLVFRVVCGEWIESMWDCMLVGDITCLPFFFSIVLICRYVLFSLFSALVLTNFRSTYYIYAQANENKTGDTLSKQPKDVDQVSPPSDDKQETEEGRRSSDDTDENLTRKSAPNCFPGFCSKKDLDEDPSRQKGWGSFRFRVYQIVENKYFEIAVVIMIIISSLALALEDVHLQKRPKLQYILYNVDIIVAVGFFIEMLMKWLGLGLRTYFSRPLCLLDFAVVVCSLINLATPLFGLQTIYILKTLRIVRLLRVIQRKKGMKVVIDTLIEAVPSICCSLFLCLIIWLTFAILGVRLFAGKYFKCVDSYGTILNYEVIPNVDACLSENYTWQNSFMNFDHLGNAYFSLLQVATFKGWINIMNDAIDSREVGLQPIRETNIYMYQYFIIFIIICSFFTLTLFIGVLLNSYNKQKSKKNGDIEFWMTEDQKKLCTALRKIDRRKPVKAIPRPEWELQAKIYETVRSKEFETIFMLIIGLNMLTLALEHYQLNQSFGMALDVISLAFLAIFSLECLLKMFAFRHHYFKDSWNLFDLSIVILSILSLVLPGHVSNIATLSLLRIVRVTKIGRLLRQVKCASKIRDLVSITSACFPALFNIVLLLFVIVFIFAVVGMSFFMNVKEKSGLDDLFNFRTFGQSVVVLIQVSTLAGWDGVLSAIANEDDCEPGETGNCGNSTLATAYILSYLLITYLIITMYIPVIFWHYSKRKEDAETGLTDDDCDMFFETWQQFDPEASNYVQHDQMPKFLDALEPPLQILKANQSKTSALDIAVNQNDAVFFVDVFGAVLEEFFTGKYRDFYKKLSSSGYEAIRSTLHRRQCERHSSRIIQNMWRKHKQPSEESKINRNGKTKPHETSVEMGTGVFP